ncbi:MAG: hypothetical protein ACLTYW_05515 [Collinsella sp.]
MPILLNAFVGHGWQGIVVQAIELVIGTLIWIPFVVANSKLAKKEQEEAAA